MKREYDFSKAEKGRFYRKDAELRLPIYLEAELQNQIARIARRQKKGISDVVNRLVRKEIEVIKELS